jgi:hypothetical protein
MDSHRIQGELFSRPTPPPGVVVVNDRVSIRTADDHRIVTVGGVLVHHYRKGDRIAEAYAMVMLVESGYADQNDVARSFGYSDRTLRRHQARFASGGLTALGQEGGRPRGRSVISKGERARDRTILRLKEEGFGNRTIGRRVGLTERAIRKRLRRLGWTPEPQQRALFSESLPPSPSSSPREKPPHEDPSRVDAFRGDSACATEAEDAALDEDEDGVEELLPRSFDTDPRDRSMDRLLAAMGLLEDASPLFASAGSVPRAGVLLAIPGLVESGVLTVAKSIYGNLAPAFYGLRTTIVAFILLALLRIKRPEALKEHAPSDLGQIVGLDRAPEVKTLRRKLARLAAMHRAAQFGRELARRRVAERGRTLGFLYVDGHVRVYHGKHTIPKTHVTRQRISLPATTDYWVNDQRGDPIFVVTAEANAPLTRMLPAILEEIRALLGSRRRATIVFDRGGWSPKLFQAVISNGFDILTYRKGRVRRVPEKRFLLRKAKLDGHPVEYRLADQPVRFLNGKLRLRQVTRLCDDGHQTPILTSRWDLRDIVIAYRMFERWRQENFFKYLREEYLIDALAEHDVEADDPARFVPNPAWKKADRKLKAARVAVAKLQAAYGERAIMNAEEKRSTMRGFKIAHAKLGKELWEARMHVAGLVAERAKLESRVPVAQANDGEPVVKLAPERKHLTNILKMVAYQIESDLVSRIRPHYARVDQEGRTLIQTALQSAAAIEPTESELHVTLAPLSSRHRSRAVAALCESLNATMTLFPGTRLRMKFAVALPPS